jgi:hypothetical protein
VSSVQAILAASRLPTVTELEERLTSAVDWSEGGAASIADLLGPIDVALARHAALIDEPFTTVPFAVPQVEADLLLPTEPEPEPEPDVELEVEVEVEVEATVLPVPVPEPDVEVEPSVQPASEVEVEAESDRVAAEEVDDPASVVPSTRPARRTTDRLLVEVPSGRDWDAEISRSAELSPLIERGFGIAGASTRVDDPASDQSPAELQPWGGAVAPTTESPDPWRHTGEIRPLARSDSGVTNSDVLGPFGEVLPAVVDDTGPDPSGTSPAARLADVDSTPIVAIVPAVAQVHEQGTPHLVSGEVVDLLEVSGLTFENDPMAVPLRPMAEPVLASEPGRDHTPSHDAGNRRHRRGRTGQQVSVGVPRRRGIVRRLLRFVFVAVLLAVVVVGGYLAVDNFVLAKRWPVSLQPVSQFVEERTGLSYERAIVVEEVPRAEFDAIVSEVRLGVPLEVAETTVSDVMASSRALGLWSGEYDPAAAARVVGRAWPAVYDPVTRIVYVDAEVTDSDRRKAVVSRELTIGLFDQVYGWSEQLSAATGGERLAYRTRMEAEALSVASAWLRELEGKPVPLGEMPPTMKFPDVDDEAWTAVPDSHEVAIRVPLVSGSPLATGEVAELSTVSTSDGALLFSTVSGASSPTLGPVGDSDVLASGLGPQGPQGVSFWLTVLQSRESPSDAVTAMRGHRSDVARTVLSDSDGDGSFDRVCVEARLETAGRVGAELLLASFERWAAMAPPQSQTIVGRDGPTAVAVRACDPGTSATTATRLTAAFDTVWFAATRSAEAALPRVDDEG